FAAQPQLENTYGPAYRVNAATAAGWAAAGQGEDAAGVDAPQRSRLRTQAVTWLRAEIELGSRNVARDPPPPRLRAAIVQPLQSWQFHTSFAALRDEPALAALPAAEREACRQLWAEAARLVERLQGKGQPEG